MNRTVFLSTTGSFITVGRGINHELTEVIAQQVRDLNLRGFLAALVGDPRSIRPVSLFHLANLGADEAEWPAAVGAFKARRPAGTSTVETAGPSGLAADAEAHDDDAAEHLTGAERHPLTRDEAEEAALHLDTIYGLLDAADIVLIGAALADGGELSEKAGRSVRALADVLQEPAAMVYQLVHDLSFDAEQAAGALEDALEPLQDWGLGRGPAEVAAQVEEDARGAAQAVAALRFHAGWVDQEIRLAAAGMGTRAAD